MMQLLQTVTVCYGSAETGQKMLVFLKGSKVPFQDAWH